MGSVSRSQIRPDPEDVIIEGTASLENKGGFASVRSASAIAANEVTFFDVKDIGALIASKNTEDQASRFRQEKWLVG
jgi:hypothetical protein